MAKKEKLRGKDLLSIGYKDTETRSLAMIIVGRKYKYESKAKKLEILQAIIDDPEAYRFDTDLGPIAIRLAEFEKNQVIYKFEDKAYNTYGEAGIEQGALMALYYADEAIVTTNPEVSSVRDSDRILGILDSKSLRAEQGLEPVKQHLLLTRYNPSRVTQGEMLSVEDVEEILHISLLGVIPESQAVLNASNKGVPVIFDENTDAGMAYSDTVDRLLGNQVEFRFLTEEKKGLFKRLFGG